jgi:hypothetical protein
MFLTIIRLQNLHFSLTSTPSKKTGNSLKPACQYRLNKIDKESSRFFGILNQMGATFAPIRSGASASIRIKYSVREITAHGNINEKNGGKDR